MDFWMDRLLQASARAAAVKEGGVFSGQIPISSAREQIWWVIAISVPVNWRGASSFDTNGSM